MEVPARVSFLSCVLFSTLFLYFSQSHSVLQGFALSDMPSKTVLTRFEQLTAEKRRHFYKVAVLEASAFLAFVEAHHDYSIVGVTEAWTALDQDDKADYIAEEHRPYLRNISASIY